MQNNNEGADKIDEMVDILREDLLAMIDSAVGEGIPWDRLSVMLSEVKATADSDPPQAQEKGERVSADQAVEMMIDQSLGLAMEKFIDELAEDKDLLLVAELILEEGHNYGFSKAVKNGATVISNLRKAREAL